MLPGDWLESKTNRKETRLLASAPDWLKRSGAGVETETETDQGNT